MVVKDITYRWNKIIIINNLMLNNYYLIKVGMHKL